jgi:NitT/TauT family transport system permease protein
MEVARQRSALALRGFPVGIESGGLSAIALRVGSTLILFIMWEFFGRRINPILFSSPTAVLKAGVDLTISGELPRAILISLRTFVAGFALALLVGIGLGLLVGRFRPVEYALRHILDALYVTPQVALIPLVILWFGLGPPAKIFIIFLVGMFPIFYNTADGVRNLSRGLVEVAKAYGASERQQFREVTVPATLPYIMTGIRLGIGRSLTGMVVAEMFTATTGLGAITVYYANTLDTARLFVPVIVLTLLGVTLLQFGQYLERRFAPWKETERAW